VSLERKDLLTLPEHMSYPRFLIGSCCSMISFKCSVLKIFVCSFGHYIVCSFSRAHEFSSGFNGLVLLNDYFFMWCFEDFCLFFWSLHCLFFFDFRLPITPLCILKLFRSVHDSFLLFPLMLLVGIPLRARCTTLCDKVCQWLAAGQWFSPASSTATM